MLSITKATVGLRPPPIQFAGHRRPKTFNSYKPLRLSSKSENAFIEDDDYGGIQMEDVKILARFKSRYNYIRVLEVARKADHPLAGSRLLLLDAPGNIHSMSYRFTDDSLTDAYYDVFATLPPILPQSGAPIALLGFGAGSAARLILETYPDVTIHGWELDPSVIDVAREFFGLKKVEFQHKERLSIFIGNALTAGVKDGYAGILVDLFSKGSVIPELQDPNTWEMLRRCLMKCGRVMVNVGGSCVEAEDKRRDGKVVMEATLNAMHKVFGDQIHVLELGVNSDDSTLALTGPLPDREAWKKAIPHKALRHYVNMWAPF
ncbi:Probable polyamine aminopropyl transferase [Linum grandiflorum]